MPNLTVIPLFLLAFGSLLRGCEPSDTARRAAEIGDPDAGAELIEIAGCGSYHSIPGIRNADGLVGPPLDHMSRRTIIAGVLENTPANMILWLQAPQEVVPDNAMPDLGLDEDQARDITAYLYTLE